MITKTSIKKVASYGEIPAVLETNEKINLIYGLNGAGKTVFSNYLADRGSADFCNCSIEGLNNEKILVYNQNFIEKNFYEKPTQKGIFTLSSENKEAEEKIEKAEEEIKGINLLLENTELKTGLRIDLEKKNTELNTLQNNAETKIWEIKTKYSGGDRILEFCLDGLKGSQKSLFDHILKIEKPKNKLEKTIEDLKKEAETTQTEKAKNYNVDEIKKVDFYFLEIEENMIFRDVIVGNDNLQISGLIKELENSDWVRRGLGYVKEPHERDKEAPENERCPFCQKQTISKELYQQIQSYFDQGYQEKILELNSLDSKYFSAYNTIKNNEHQYLENPFIKNRETEFKLLFNNLIQKLSSNWSEINKKVKNPSQAVILESSLLEKSALNDFLNEIIKEIKAHNLKIQDKEKTKKEIIDNFWQIMRWDYDQTIENYYVQKDKLDQEKKEIEGRIVKFTDDKTGQENIIKDAQKESINIDDAIDNIKSELKFFGAEGFTIIKVGKDSYKLQRLGEEKTSFKTFSEGEKTIISFLYFLELCKGKESEDEGVTEKVIVIDDPISSLSHIYVFNVAQLIRGLFSSDKYKQVFILTHNLYFFHELLYKQKKIKLFRITKSSDKGSNISEMQQNEIQNDYQAYWQIIKDHGDGKASNALLANSMRNIVEHFFCFIDKKKDFGEITKSLESEEKYCFFIRYINKESHSDAVNICDTKEIEPDIFKEAFQKIFEDSGYKDHYNKMMGC
jgi:wobble nucleotide-excising tRNase